MKRFFFWNRPEKADSAPPEDASLDSALLTGNPGQDELFVNILLESIADVSSNMDLDDVLRAIVAKSLEVTKAERAVVFLGSTPESLEIVVSRGREGEKLGKDLQYSKTVVHRCIEEGQAMRSVVQSDQEALQLGQSVFDLKLRAVMCAPLVAKEEIVGAIYVDSRAARREFSARDLALFGALTAQLAIAVDNARLYADSIEKVRLEKDVEIARRIQHHLLPAIPTSVPGIEIALRYRAAEKASGDTYDFTPVGDGKLAVMLGDVTGHGVGAALLTHSAQAGLQSYLELIEDVSEVVSRLNNRLVASVETGNFMSLLLAVVDGTGRTLHYVNAGHPEIIVVRDGAVQSHEKSGMVLGVVAETDYEVKGPLPLQPGDLIFLRTDGVEETLSPEREVYGEDELERVLADSCDLSAEEALARIERELEQHARGQPFEDDVTMIAIKVLP